MANFKSKRMSYWLWKSAERCLQETFFKTDPQHPGHFKTYLQMVFRVLDGTLLLAKAAPADQFIHRQAGTDAENGTTERCEHCKYVFLSAADKLRHNRLSHSSEGTTSRQQKEHVCSYLDGASTCGLAFTTYYGLMQHKKAAGHKCSRGRPKKS